MTKKKSQPSRAANVRLHLGGIYSSALAKVLRGGRAAGQGGVPGRRSQGRRERAGPAILRRKCAYFVHSLHRYCASVVASSRGHLLLYSSTSAVKLFIARVLRVVPYIPVSAYVVYGS